MAALIIITLYGLYLVVVGEVSVWWIVLGVVWAKISQLFGHNIGIHRFYTHRSFKTTKPWEYDIAFLVFSVESVPPYIMSICTDYTTNTVTPNWTRTIPEMAH